MNKKYNRRIKVFLSFSGNILIEKNIYGGDFGGAKLSNHINPSQHWLDKFSLIVFQRLTLGVGKLTPFLCNLGWIYED